MTRGFPFGELVWSVVLVVVDDGVLLALDAHAVVDGFIDHYAGGFAVAYFAGLVGDGRLELGDVVLEVLDKVRRHAVADEFRSYLSGCGGGGHAERGVDHILIATPQGHAELGVEAG